jgi:hypothetical protein
MGISLVPPCGTRVLFHVLHPIFLGAPTLGGDIVVKYELEALNSIDGRVNSHSIALPLDSMFFSLSIDTMGQVSPSFRLYSETEK